MESSSNSDSDSGTSSDTSSEGISSSDSDDLEEEEEEGQSIEESEEEDSDSETEAQHHSDTQVPFPLDLSLRDQQCLVINALSPGIPLAALNGRQDNRLSHCVSRCYYMAFQTQKQMDRKQLKKPRKKEHTSHYLLCLNPRLTHHSNPSRSSLRFCHSSFHLFSKALRQRRNL